MASRDVLARKVPAAWLRLDAPSPFWPLTKGSTRHRGGLVLPYRWPLLRLMQMMASYAGDAD
ncbi:hypothetical protein [Methylobacterium nigriterrae]|uniref:hypothetical protein n=1 Tax=Methylobacterium nigriterrae TaxID=3127512 RepID=UPI003013D6BE